jgi:hypothetical protein
MNHTLTEVLELRQFAEDRLEAHLSEVNAVDREHRKKAFNEHLIVYIDELNEKCKEINGEDCGNGQGPYKSMYALINEYQNRFIARY